MKTFVIIVGLVAAASPAVFGQGTIDVENINKAGGFIQPIFNYNPAAPYVQQVGNPSPTVYSGAILNGVTGGGTTVYGGAALVGAGFDMVFFYSLNTSVTSVFQMNVGTIIPFRTAATATAPPAGGIIGTTIAIPGGTGGTPIAFAYGAFSTEGGTVQTWAQVMANLYGGHYTEFGIGQIATTELNGSDTAGVPHVGNTSDQGWTSFELVGSPEPSTFALVSLGGVALLFYRRLKSLLSQFTSHLRPVPRSNRRDR